jgi:hypothetical protein
MTRAKKDGLGNAKLEKIDVCFEHTKLVYENQLTRFRDLDSKASVIINTVSAIIAVILVGFAYLFGKDAIVKVLYLFVIAILSCVISLSFLFKAGWMAIKAFRCVILKDIAEPRGILDLYVTDYEKATIVRIKEELAISYCDAVDSYIKANDEKARYVTSAQNSLKWSMLSLLIFVFILIVNPFCGGGDKVSSSNDDKTISTKPARPSDRLRNPKIIPMEVVGRRSFPVMDSDTVLRKDGLGETAATRNTRIEKRNSNKESGNSRKDRE